MSRRTAFVLTGGATRGAVQVGALLALTEASIVPDLLVGTSVGALNAAVFSAKPDEAGLQHLGRLWEEAPRSQIFPFSPLSMMKRVASRTGHLLPNDGLRRWIEDQTAHSLIEDFPVPLHVVTTEVATGRAVVLSRGDAVTALLASTAIPGVFPPIEVAGRLLYDGAVAADAPIEEAADLGAATVYLLPAAPHGSSADPSFGPSAASVRARSFQLLDHLFGRPGEDPRHRDRPGVAVHWLPAPPVADTNPFSFRASRRLIDEAYDLTRRWLADPPAAPDWGSDPKLAG